MAQQREEYIKQKHNYKIYQGRDGKWYTYVMGDNGKRKKIKRNTEAEVKDILFKHLFCLTFTMLFMCSLAYLFSC